MSIIKKPIKKILWGLSLVFGLALVFFVKAFGVNPLGPIAQADFPIDNPEEAIDWGGDGAGSDSSSESGSY